MAATVTNDELSAQARLISWRPSFLSSFPPPMFPVSLFSAPSWLSHGSSLFIPLPSIRPSLASPSSNRPGATGAQCPRKCGMADDKSGVPLISAYDRGSVYGEHTTNDFRRYLFIRTWLVQIRKTNQNFRGQVKPFSIWQQILLVNLKRIVSIHLYSTYIFICIYIILNYTCNRILLVEYFRFYVALKLLYNFLRILAFSFKYTETSR